MAIDMLTLDLKNTRTNTQTHTTGDSNSVSLVGLDVFELFVGLKELITVNARALISL